MEKETSCINSRAILSYLKAHDIDYSGMIKDLVAPVYFLSRLRIDTVVERQQQPVTGQRIGDHLPQGFP